MAKSKPRPGDSPGRYAYDGLDRVIHEKARLGIIASLATHPGGLLFNDLKELCALTDGNLSRHLQILSEAGVVQIWKGFKDNRPQTLCQLTEEAGGASSSTSPCSKTSSPTRSARPRSSPPTNYRKAGRQLEFFCRRTLHGKRIVAAKRLPRLRVRGSRDRCRCPLRTNHEHH